MERRPEDLTLSEVMEHVRGYEEVIDKLFPDLERRVDPDNQDFNRLGLTEKLVYVMAIAVKTQARALTLMEKMLNQMLKESN